ncbi:LysR family transcriptional regulator [Saccharothrix algeriensis]|uniref:DNA-binding transcriptional LysR family regulator n=1 Tax=Saccharothrix algeriensis TaxID=173560 RepID=A0A8T8I4T3_9PSEU|nr:LysR family transcriptional regulator [Saccharothrix algeriensis]MBM7811634.1 DNA-binding transcriptional LysR family regulator [Saccharothrix algeriensis]QTR05420.1 LysR family transcriptional regulator [Saccharothrix algeriensis]
MDTRLLRTLLVLARTGSFTAAAAQLHLVQSTVTSQVKALERQLGARLFDRLPTGARLTEAGRRAVEHAREVLAAEQRLRDAVRGGTAVEGDVRVGAPESVCAYRLPQRIADVALRWPGITVHLTPVGTRDAIAGVRGGDLDLGLVLEEAVVAPGLAVDVVGAEPIELVAAPGAPGADERYFLLEEGCSYTDRFVRELTATPTITRFGSIEAVRSCVVAGLGRAVLPRVAVAEQLDAGALRRVRELPGSTLFLLTDPRRTPSAAARVVAGAVGAAGAVG